MTTTLGLPLAPDPELFAELSAGVWERARWSNGGPLVTELERELAAREGWQHVIATSSGTAALTAALLALELPAGGEVITTPLTFRATTLAIEAAGLTPVFVAVDPETLNLSAAAVAEAINERTAAIAPVHLFGLAVDPAIDQLAAQHGVPVVYDAAHTFGLADAAGRGTLTAYSLHATKLLHTGEGGFVATNDEALAQRVREVINFGIDAAGGHAGFNGKLAELPAAVGLAVLPKLEAEIAARLALRSRYAEIIASSSRVQQHAPGSERALIIEVFRCEPSDQARILAELAERDVIARAFPALVDGGRFACFPVVGGSAKEAIALSQTVIALPFHGGVDAAAVAAIAEVLAQ